MRAETVYRVDYLLRPARILFASDTADAVHIVIDVNQARGAILQDRRGSFEDAMSLPGC